MRPIVLVPNKNGKLELTKEELQNLLDEAYEQGKRDAVLTTTTNPPPLSIPTPHYSTDHMPYDRYAFTCDGGVKNGDLSN